MHFLHLNRQAARHFQHQKPYIIISITDPGSERNTFHQHPMLRGVLELQFHDLTQKDLTDWPTLVKKYRYFVPADAKKIVTFVRRYMQPGDLDLVMVHCEAGISRSAGCAAALAKAITGNDFHFFNVARPNMLVYRGVLAEWQKTVKV